jgi:hypothetical protein
MENGIQRFEGLRKLKAQRRVTLAKRHRDESPSAVAERRARQRAAVASIAAPLPPGCSPGLGIFGPGGVVDRALTGFVDPPPRPSWVYFIQAAGPAGLIKIGTSVSPLQRLRSMSSSAPLVLLATTPGSRTRELELQVQFEEALDHDEWFRPSPALLAFINSLPKESR